VRQDELIEGEKGEDKVEKVAVGYDPEDNPSPLFDYGFYFARLLCGELIIVHAIETIVDPQNLEEEEKQITAEVEKIVDSLPSWVKDGVKYSVEIIYGKEVENFVQFVEERGVDLFGFYYYKKFLGKTLSQDFLEKLPTSLLVLKEDTPFREIRRVLVPLDFSKNSLGQKEFVEKLKSCNGEMEFDFLHVMDGEDSSEEEELKLLFNELFDGLGSLRIAYGDPAEEIVKAVEEGNYDLVVLGRIGKGLNFEFGNVTKEVLEEVKCPVVVV
jgi:nucleotide-binding universal stress UspA family protein